ncbi:hypothetical protein LINPERHAP1_LOCUS22875 [Linum perenne]
MQIRRLLLKPEKMASPISFSTTIHLSWEFSSLYSLTSSTLASVSVSPSCLSPPPSSSSESKICT